MTRQPGGASLGMKGGERHYSHFPRRAKGSPRDGDEKLGISAVSRTGCITYFSLLNKLFLWLMRRLKLVSLIPGH